MQSYSCLPEGHSSHDPRVRNYAPEYNTCGFLPECLSRADIYAELRAHIIACRTILPSISGVACIVRRTPGQMKQKIMYSSCLFTSMLFRKTKQATHSCAGYTTTKTIPRTWQHQNPCNYKYVQEGSLHASKQHQQHQQQALDPQGSSRIAAPADRSTASAVFAGGGGTAIIARLLAGAGSCTASSLAGVDAEAIGSELLYLSLIHI